MSNNLQQVYYCLDSSHPTLNSVSVDRENACPFPHCIWQRVSPTSLLPFHRLCAHLSPECAHSQQPAFASLFRGLPLRLRKASWINWHQNTENLRLGIQIAPVTKE